MRINSPSQKNPPPVLCYVRKSGSRGYLIKEVGYFLPCLLLFSSKEGGGLLYLIAETRNHQKVDIIWEGILFGYFFLKREVYRINTISERSEVEFLGQLTQLLLGRHPSTVNTRQVVHGGEVRVILSKRNQRGTCGLMLNSFLGIMKILLIILKGIRLNQKKINSINSINSMYSIN